MTSAPAPIRVLWLINQLGAGGAERLLISAARRHARDEFTFEAAYVLAWHDALAGELEGCGVPVHSLGVQHALDLRWARRVHRLIRTGNFHIVHVHSPFVAGVARLLLRTIPRRRRPRLVVTAHAAWHSYRRVTRLITTLTLPLDDAHLAVSEDSKAGMPRWLQSRTRVVVQGVLVEELAGMRVFRDSVRRELGVADDEILIVTVANLVPEKNYPDLLRAARRVISSGLPVQFISVGGGPLEQELRNLHRTLGLGDRYRFLGYRPDAVKIMSGADLFVLASNYEGYPVAVMEALAVGVPVVATAVGGIPHAVTHGVQGLVVPPRRPDALAASICELALDEKRRDAMAAAARERSSYFDMRRTVRAVEAVYRDVLYGRDGANPLPKMT